MTIHVLKYRKGSCCFVTRSQQCDKQTKQNKKMINQENKINILSY